MIGTEVAKLIREFNPTIPIVFYSATSYEADMQAAFDAGADPTLQNRSVWTSCLTKSRGRQSRSAPD